MTNSIELNAIVDRALNALWHEVAQLFPEVTSGDLSPGTEAMLHQAAETAIEEWLSNNSLFSFA